MVATPNNNSGRKSQDQDGNENGLTALSPTFPELVGRSAGKDQEIKNAPHATLLLFREGGNEVVRVAPFFFDKFTLPYPVSPIFAS